MSDERTPISLYIGCLTSSTVSKTCEASQMSTFVPPQLASILGDDLESIDETSLKKLVGIAESDVLEYKSEHYGTGDAQRRELAWDLAGFANAGGGLLIVGMSEDDDTGVATGIVPLSARPHVGEEDTRYRQIVASSVFPILQVVQSSV